MTNQPSLFDQPQAPEPAHHTKPELNLPKIEAELQEDAGNIRVKVVRGNGDNTRVSIRETDNLIHIRINPKRIRTQAQLDRVMDFCRSSINWDYQA